MSRYRVELYVNDKIVATLYQNAFSRKEAYIDCINSKEYAEATKRAKKLGKQVMWDATKIGEAKHESS